MPGNTLGPALNPSASAAAPPAAAPAGSAAPPPVLPPPLPPTVDAVMPPAGAPPASGPSTSTPAKGHPAARQPQSVADVVAASVGARRERKRKRIHYSCAECYRRKSKCDRKTPCQPCIDRGIGDTCRPFEDGDEHGDARDRIQRLEEIVEGLGIAQASLAKELATLQHAHQAVIGSLGKGKAYVGGPLALTQAGTNLSALDADSDLRLASVEGIDTGSSRPRVATASHIDGLPSSSRGALYRNSSSSAFSTGPLSLSHRPASPEDSRDGASRSRGGRAHSYSYSHDNEDDDGGNDSSVHHRNPDDLDVSMGDDLDSDAGPITAKVEPADNLEGGLTVEGGMHGEANWYGALALPSVSRSVVRTEIRGEHLELHADLPRCPASVKLYRLIHEGGAPEDILQQLMADLPPKEICDNLVHLYFRDINWTRLPIHEASFRQSYDELMEFRSGQSPSESGETGGRHTPFLALLFVILATVKRSQPEDMGSEEDARTGSIKLLHGFKKTAAIAASIRIDHIDMLVAHLLAARWYIVNRHSGEAWAALGFAVRGAQAMGLHRDGSKLGLDAVTTERRRRLFSLVQYLDSTTSILLGRPVGINPAHCDSQPPSDTDIDTMPRASRPHNAVIYRDGMPPGIFAFVAIRHEMNRLTGRIVEHFQNLEKARQYADVMQIDQDLRTFGDNLPGPYRHTDTDTQYDSICPWLPLHRYLLNIEIFYFRITLHRPYMLRSSDAKYDFSRRAAIESAKADRLLREEYKRTVLWPSNQCRRTFMGGLYRLFNTTLIFAVALLQDPKGPDAASFAGYLDAFIQRHRSADRTDAATRREVKIIELFRAKALDPTWCALTATGAAPHPNKAMLAIHGLGTVRASSGQRRSTSRPRHGPAAAGKATTAAPFGSDTSGTSPSTEHRRASSTTGGIHFGDERSVIHGESAAGPPDTAASSIQSTEGNSSIPALSNGINAPAYAQSAAALAHLRASNAGSFARPMHADAGSGANSLSPAAGSGANALVLPSIQRPSYVTTTSENGTNGIIVPGTMTQHASSPSAFSSLFGSAMGNSAARGGGTPGGTNGFWTTTLASGSGQTPAPGAGLLGASSAFDLTGGLSLNSFGGGGGFGSAMGLGDADFAQSLFDQLGVSLDQFGLASGSGTVVGEGGGFVSGQGASQGLHALSQGIDGGSLGGGPGVMQSHVIGQGGDGTFGFDFDGPSADSAGMGAQAQMVGYPSAGPSAGTAALHPSGSGPINASGSRAGSTQAGLPLGSLTALPSSAAADSAGVGDPSSTAASDWAGLRAWGPLVEAIALATGGSHSTGVGAGLESVDGPRGNKRGRGRE
ncbi:hypothetical protein V8E36_000985 [Tilletia maclaganii]